MAKAPKAPRRPRAPHVESPEENAGPRAQVHSRGVRAARGLKVEAIADGYYDHIYRRAGDVFTIASTKEFSEKWMQYVDPQAREKVTGAQEALSREHQRLTTEAAGNQSVGPDNPTGAAGVLGD